MQSTCKRSKWLIADLQVVFASQAACCQICAEAGHQRSSRQRSEPGDARAEAASPSSRGSAVYTAAGASKQQCAGSALLTEASPALCTVSSTVHTAQSSTLAFCSLANRHAGQKRAMAAASVDPSAADAADAVCDARLRLSWPAHRSAAGLRFPWWPAAVVGLRSHLERETNYNIPASQLIVVQPHTCIWIPGKPRESKKRKAQACEARRMHVSLSWGQL